MDSAEWPEGMTALMADICVEWDTAEAEIKRAELICGEIVLPSVNELRYAGRRLVDAMVAVRNHNTSEHVRALLSDVKFNCHRARHDAIDAGSAKIASDLEEVLKTFGPAVVATSFSSLPALVQKLQVLRSQIIESREHREQRDKIYNNISATTFRDLTELHSQLIAISTVLVPISNEKKKRTLLEWFFFLGGWITAVIFGAISVLAWRFPHALGG